MLNSILHGASLRNGWRAHFISGAICLLATGTLLGGEQPVGVLLPTGSEWRYATNYPPARWQELKFEDSAWSRGRGGFGDLTEKGRSVASSSWRSGQLWLRREFELRTVPAALQLTLRHRADVRVYINGKLAADFTGNTPGYVPVPVQGEAQAMLGRGRNMLAVHATCIGPSPFIDVGLEVAGEAGKVDAPLYRDPRFDGAADPTVIWDRERKVWRMFYTQRRANVKELPGVGYCYGCDIGMAISEDGGRSWRYDGEAQGLEYEGGRNTF